MRGFLFEKQKCVNHHREISFSLYNLNIYFLKILRIEFKLIHCKRKNGSDHFWWRITLYTYTAQLISMTNTWREFSVFVSKR